MHQVHGGSDSTYTLKHSWAGRQLSHTHTSTAKWLAVDVQIRCSKHTGEDTNSAGVWVWGEREGKKMRTVERDSGGRPGRNQGE